MKLAIILFCIVLSKNVLAQEQGEYCTDDKGAGGVCTPLEHCESEIQNVKSGKFPKICGFDVKIAIVCCVTLDTSTKITEVINNVSNVSNNTSLVTNSSRIPGDISKAKCKEYAKYSYQPIVSPLLSTQPQYEQIYDCHVNAEILTIRSIEASRKEYPHMGHVGFNDIENGGIKYKCGGTLISENFVLTAAHCLNDRELGRPVLIRFGVTNIDDYEHRQEIKISDYFAHPDFKRAYHDVGLLKLEKSVEFNEFVRPACLNTVRDIHYRTGVVSGWGVKSIESPVSKNLLKSILEIVPNGPCNDSYPNIPFLSRGIVEDWMICAAITSDQRKDPCQGDSGSPLQVRIQNSEELQCMSLIIGITSFGKTCGLVGEPGVYTRISNYIEWIERIVWPELY